MNPNNPAEQPQNVFVAESPLPPEGSPEMDALKQAAKKEGRKAIIIGVLLLGLGALMTAVSYSAAAEGSSFTIFTGLIVVGIIDIIRGIYFICNPKALINKAQKNKK